MNELILRKLSHEQAGSTKSVIDVSIHLSIFTTLIRVRQPCRGEGRGFAFEHGRFRERVNKWRKSFVYKRAIRGTNIEWLLRFGRILEVSLRKIQCPIGKGGLLNWRRKAKVFSRTLLKKEALLLCMRSPFNLGATEASSDSLRARHVKGKNQTWAGQTWYTFPAEYQPPYSISCSSCSQHGLAREA